MRVGFLRTLDEHDARALLNAVEDDLGAVRRNVEIADHEAGWQIGQLALASGPRIQLPEYRRNPLQRHQHCDGYHALLRQL